MPKYLFEGHYTPEGAKGVAKEGGSGRRDALAKAAESVGGKLESFYFAFGGVDAYVTVDLPDNVAAAAMALAVNQGNTATAKMNATTRTRRCSNFADALAKKSTVANRTVFARY